MQLTVIQRILGLLLIAFSITLFPPMWVSLWYEDGTLPVFIVAFSVMFGAGFVVWLPARHVKRELHLHDGFVITAVFWTFLSIIGALPFFFCNHPDLNLTVAQSVFEAISGFTTTGATVIQHIDELPKSILYYRQQLHWLGGLGIIVLAVAVLPILGIGGMQLYRAETPGPMRDERLTPRLENTAKALLYIYISLTITCAIAYKLAGMDWFDAIGHSYSTVATGGFSTHDDSIGYYTRLGFSSSLAIEIISMIFMILGSLNFTIHFIAWRKLNLRYYWEDIQARVFLSIVLGLITISVIILFTENIYDNFWTALRYASFEVISIISSTGYATTDFSQWPLFLPALILSSGFIGGCVGSTAGGFRVIRVVLLYKQALREIMRLIHPNATIVVKIGNKRISDRVASAVWGFSSLYIASYVFLSFLFMATGVDLITAFSGIAATLNMTGPGLGNVALNYSGINSPGLWILSFTMLLARLEIFTLLVLLAPAFWRK